MSALSVIVDRSVLLSELYDAFLYLFHHQHLADRDCCRTCSTDSYALRRSLIECKKEPNQKRNKKKKRRRKVTRRKRGLQTARDYIYVICRYMWLYLSVRQNIAILPPFRVQNFVLIDFVLLWARLPTDIMLSKQPRLLALLSTHSDMITDLA